MFVESYMTFSLFGWIIIVFVDRLKDVCCFFFLVVFVKLTFVDVRFVKEECVYGIYNLSIVVYVHLECYSYLKVKYGLKGLYREWALNSFILNVLNVSWIDSTLLLPSL